ncbi:MAG: phage holin family protein [Bacteroidales bacterium]|nr:phage holin family protein [Bacteroidales bacterium]
MNEKSPVISELRQLITEYFDARLKLIKLETFEKIAKVTAVLFSSLVVALLGFFLLFFLSMSLGFFLGKIFDSMALGFLSVTGLYLILFMLVLFMKKDLMENFLIERIIGELTKKEDDDEQIS